MSDWTPLQLLEWINKIGIVGIVIMILFASYKGWWVWGKDYSRLERDRDEWKAIAFKFLHIAQAQATTMSNTDSTST